MANTSAGGPCKHVVERSGRGRRIVQFHKESVNDRTVTAKRCLYCSSVRVEMRLANKLKGISGWDGPWRDWLNAGHPGEANWENIKAGFKGSGYFALGCMAVVLFGIFGTSILEAVHVRLAAPKHAVPSKIDYEQTANRMHESLIAYVKDESRRMAGIYWRISTANADRCGGNGRDYGLFLSNVAHNNHPLRPLYAKTFGETNRHVYYVASGSPAEAAGVRPGDQIVAINHEKVEANIELVPMFKRLVAAGRDGQPVEMELDRNGTNLTATVTPVPACPYLFVSQIDDGFNAFSDGLFVTMHTGIADNGMTDDAIAMVIGHEIAHNRLDHKSVSISQSTLNDLSIMNKWFPNWDLFSRISDMRHGLEIDADFDGAELAERAGYSREGIDIFAINQARRLPAEILEYSFTHPSHAQRNFALEHPKSAE